jgi:hypothetical protein
MLSDIDKVYVIEKLIFWIAPLQDPRATLTAPFIGTTLPQNLGQGLPNQLVIEAVQLCLVDGWNHDPPWLWWLLFPLQGTDAKIAEIMTRVRNPPPPASDPLNTTILSAGAPFVNRTELRGQLSRLATPAAKAQPIFVINGLAKSGKSYSINYIEYFSYNQPLSIIPSRLEFDSDLGPDIGPTQVASDLVSMMGRPLKDMPEPNTNQKLYTRNLALWVLNQAAQTPWQHWFILDNFRGEKLRPDTRDLLIALSDRVTTGVFPQQCRLILIGFDRALLTVDPGKVEEETIQPCSPDEVKASISEILKRAPVPVAADRVSPIILSNLPNGESKMVEINTRLRALLSAVSEVKQILAGLSGANYADYEKVLLKMLEDLPAGQERIQELESRLEALRESARGL